MIHGLPRILHYYQRNNCGEMEMGTEKESTDWSAVAARALAYQSLHLSGLGDASLIQKGQFLMTLGLSRAEAAALIGSTDDSLRVQMGRAKRKAAASGSE